MVGFLSFNARIQGKSLRPEQAFTEPTESTFFKNGFLVQLGFPPGSDRAWGSAKRPASEVDCGLVPARSREEQKRLCSQPCEQGVPGLTCNVCLGRLTWQFCVPDIKPMVIQVQE